MEFRPGIAFILLLASLGSQAFPQLAARAATTERVVVNRYSGVAIEGFDPVAYFVDARPLVGLPEFEASDAGAVWRFRNEGNRASFVAHPDIYGPQFGGYDPIDLARGVTFAGNPRFWLVSGQRLFLFGREENRDAFAAAPARFLQQAKCAGRRWSRVWRSSGPIFVIATSEGGSDEAIQLFLVRLMDCFAEPVIGRAFARPVGSQ